jgi:hypothetical protein
MGRAARQRVAKLFSEDRMVAQLEALLLGYQPGSAPVVSETAR